MFGYDGSIRIKADLNHNGFDSGLSSMTGSVQRFRNTLMKLAGIVGIAFGTAAIINFGKESINLASDIEEVQNVIDVTFGRGTKQIEEFAQSAAEAYGLSELAAKQYTGTMGAMLKSSGLATSAAQEMSMTLTGLAGDIASFYNLGTDTAFEKIRAGISGETEPLKQLGINMSVANLEAYALSKGITKNYNAMSQTEQVLLRYNYLLSVTTDAQGDFARTSGSFANQIRILQLNFDQLRIAVGNALIPIAQAVLPSINAIIAGLTKLAKVFARVTALLFGKSSQATASSGIASSASAAADATDDLAAATEGAGNASESAAKKMKGVLAGFDELNVLADNASSSLGGAADGLGAGAGELDIPSYESEIDEANQLEEAFSSLGELFVKTLDDMLAAMPTFKQTLLDFAANFNDFNQKLYDGFKFDGVLARVELLGQELAKAFNDLVNAIDWELWGRTLGAGLNLGLQFLTEFIYTFDWVNLGQKLADFINGLVYEVDWYDFGRLLWAQFKIALETFTGFITGLDMPALAKAASNIMMGFFDEMKNTIAKIDWAEIGRQVARFLSEIDWMGILSSVWGAFKEAVMAGFDFLAGVIEEGSPGLLAAVSVIAAALGVEFATNVVPKIVNVANAFGSFFKKIKDISVLLKYEMANLSGAINAVFGPGSTLAGIAMVVGGAVLAFTNFFSMLQNGFSMANEALMLLGIALTAVGAVILGAPAMVAGVIAGIVAVVATAAVLISENWESIKAAAVNAWEAVKEAWAVAGEWIATNVVQPVADFFAGLWEFVTMTASNAWQTIQEIWSVVSGWFSENIIEPVKTFFSELWETVKTLASEALEVIKTVWSVAADWFRTSVVDTVKQIFTEMWSGVKEAGSSAWESIRSAWQNASKWFEDYVTGPLGKAFEKVVGTVKNAINGMIGAVEGMVNSVIKAVNWLIDQLNKIRFDVPDWVPGVGGRSFGFNIQRVSEVTLPRLANGAVIPPNQQFAAILGDQRSGTNIETPLSTMVQAFKQALNEGGYANSNRDVTVILQMDKREFGRAVYSANNEETQRVGVRLARGTT
ncbi:MAG: hypothetical protein HFF84_09745 [Oscillibacter sp.]|nr:hypothetical protein [Oscillibacter sp.]